MSTVIRRSPQDVYAYASDANNLPAWAAGLTDAPISRDGDALVTESPLGRIRMVFAPRNEFGVLDHWVTLPSGVTTYNALRVIEHPDGAEIIFTLRQLDATDDEFARDAGLVAADLERLRGILEA
ncbi:SRPBCC family protein [Humibacter sp.]|uniref:SRPBCC family protein n=1 Tax=Humibacter sp. TaxID=1940291 RepID=UPI002C931F07|nr:SRPBCC family protein [Humibacter sp.]HVX08741.1 SRPBCC family protein [Humibacter sp.]